MCDLDTIDVSSILRLLRNTAVLERIFPTLDLSCEKNTHDGNGTGWIAQAELLKQSRSGRFLDESMKIKTEVMTSGNNVGGTITIVSTIGKYFIGGSLI